MNLLVATNKVINESHGNFAVQASLALAEAGNSVCLVGSYLAEDNDPFQVAGIELSQELSDLKERSFDAILSDDAVSAMPARHFFPDTPIALILAGKVKPPSVNIGVSTFIRPAGLQLTGTIKEAGVDLAPIIEIPFSERKELAGELEKLLRRLCDGPTPSVSVSIPYREILFYSAVSKEHHVLVEQVRRLEEEHQRLRSDLAQLSPKIDAVRNRFNKEIAVIKAEREPRGVGLIPVFSETSQPRNTELPERDCYRGENLVFILGPPRSGTTWVLSLMKEHPDAVAATVDNLGVRINDAETLETGIFLEDRGLGDEQIRDRFYDLSAAHPGKVIVEKTPIHTLYADRIRAIFPHSALLLVQRDGRDVVASMIKVGKDRDAWRRGAPGDVADAAALWLLYAETALACERNHHPIKVLYEDLLANPEAELTRVLAALAMSTTLVRKQIESSRAGKNIPITGVFHQGKSGTWRTQLSSSDITRFKEITGKMLIDLGYESDNSWNLS
jgi:hypothetical protein